MFALLIPLALVAQAAAPDVPLTGRANVHFASVEEGTKLLGTPDEYSKAMTPLDRSLMTESAKPVTTEQYLSHASKQVLEWSPEQRATLTASLERIGKRLAPLKLEFPSVVTFIQTTGKEEAGTAYCRGDSIILARNMLVRSPAGLDQLLTHELFHIYSRNHLKLRDRLYAIVGFTPCGAIELPAELQARTITNPDAPRPLHAIEITIDGQTVRAIPLLYSNSEHYDEQRRGGLFDYLIFRLVPIERQGDGWKWKPSPEGKPMFIDPQLAAGFAEKIGKNTSYTIHPEEILADNFALLVQGKTDVPTPRILTEMRAIIEGN